MSRVSKAIRDLVMALDRDEPHTFREHDTVGIAWVTADGSHLTVSLHGNEIIRVTDYHDGETSVEVRDCGWPTATTRNRLNAVLMHLSIPDKVVSSQAGLSFGSTQGPALSNNWLDVAVKREQK